jgi:DNA polymerase
MADAGIDRSGTYVTNAVKHFKWRPSARSTKVRLHQTPSSSEVAACRPWLAAELERVAPQVLVLMGATAAKALLGPGFRVTHNRGEWLDGVAAGGAPLPEGTLVTATIHPSAVLRATQRDELYESLVHDLSFAASAL